MSYLLDTDICIYWLNGKKSVRDKLLEIGFQEVSICVITVSELYFGAYNSIKIKQNLTTAEKFIQNIVVLSLSNQTLKQFGQLKAQLRKAGTPVADFDLLIASVAITENLILVTNNTRHYQHIPNLILDNWS